MELLARYIHTMVCVAAISLSSVLPRADVVARSPTGNFSLYAYGSNIFGSRLYYVDSEAYVAPMGAPASNSQAANVTFNANDTSLSALPDVGTWMSTPMLSVPSTSDEVAAVSFTTDTSTGDTTNFGFYGQWLYHQSSDGSFDMKFYASATNETDVYKVVWDQSGSAEFNTDLTYVSIRTTPPTNASSSVA